MRLRRRGFRRLIPMKIASQDKVITGLQEQIDNLQMQLVSARADAKDVASEALKSASGRQVAEALQRVVDTQQPVTKGAK